MPQTVGSTVSATIMSKTYSMDQSTTGDNGVESTPTVGAGPTGVLTTRTDNTSGSFTVDGGSNPISTGDKFDVYWTVSGVGGRRLNVTAGTVAGQVIPFTATGATGDNLPAAASAVTIVKHVPETGLAIPVANLNALACKADGTNRVTYTFKDGSNAVLFAVTCTAGKDYVWSSGSGITNPVSAGTIASVTFTHDGTISKVGQSALIWS